jgi:hypothetical protein
MTPWFSKALRLTALALVLGATPILQAQDYTYTTNNGAITITGSTFYPDPNMPIPPFEVSVPSEINGWPVTRIGDGAFAFAHWIGKIAIPNSVSTIGDRAFTGCFYLDSIAIPDGVTSIGEKAFQACPSMISVTIPNSVTNIAQDAFSSCSGLMAIAVDSLNPFYCSVEGVLFDKGTNTLIQYPGGGAGSYTVPRTVTNLLSRAFAWCGGLREIIIPDGVRIIGDWAFDHCTGLTNIILSDSVIAIGEDAFYFCEELTKITIPKGVTNIGKHPFEHCPRLIGITVDPLNPFYCSVEGVLFDKGTNTLIQCPMTKTGAYSIPEGVTGIGEGAFKYCTGLTSVTIPDSVTRLGEGALANCRSLTNLVIGNRVSDIGRWAFYNCSSLESISIPCSVTNLGQVAFTYCLNLKAITVDPLNLSYSSVDGVLFDKNRTVLLVFPSGKGGDYAVPDGVVSIADSHIGGFYDCPRLKSVTMPNSLTTIGEMAFYDCPTLSHVEMGTSVTRIGPYAFWSCTNLTNIVLPDSITRIGASAFAGCRSLTVVTIPNRISSIEIGVFTGCTSLTNIMIPAGVTDIGEWAFSSCASLMAAYFHGNAPNVGSNVFNAANNSLVVYYLPGTRGWGPTFGGRPTAIWALPSPVILTIAPDFGIQPSGFGFTISWATNTTVVVEASADIGSATWSPLFTNSLANGTSYFSDPEWTNYPGRFYRVRSP